MKIAFHTLGCKVNQYETEAMKTQFQNASYQIVDDKEVADIYVINTCTVTGLADRKSRQYIRKMKKNNPDSIVVAVGCYVQMREEEAKAIEGVNILIGTNQKAKLVSHVEAYLEEQKSGKSIENHKVAHVCSYAELENYEDMGLVSASTSRNRAYIKIQEGCNRFCSYCIIPLARGRVRSRSRADILEEVKNLVNQGFQEIVLTGINTALYEDLLGLLQDIDKMEGEFRVRLSSLEPTVVNEAFVNEIIKSKRLCHHLHLSIQSGSNKILKAMRRNYIQNEYLNIVNLLKDFDPLYGITTDIIVGFPGEEAEDFCDSLALVKQVEFCDIHVFQYSKRDNTPAAKMKNQVEAQIKKERSKQLIDLGKETSLKFHKKNIGARTKILIEEVDGEYLTGYTDNYIKAYLPIKGLTDKKYLVDSMIDKDSKKINISAMVNVEIIDVYKDGVLVKGWN